MRVGACIGAGGGEAASVRPTASIQEAVPFRVLVEPPAKVRGIDDPAKLSEPVLTPLSPPQKNQTPRCTPQSTPVSVGTR